MNEHRNEHRNELLQRWLPVVIMFVSCLVTVGIAWGSLSTRITIIEEQTRDQITRHEYEDLKERMTRIENKLDVELRKR